MAKFVFFILILTLLSVVVVSAIPRERVTELKVCSLSLSVLIFFVSLIPFYWFDYHSSSFQFFCTLDWFRFTNIPISYGIDGISLFFLVLTTFLIPICIISSWESVQKSVKEFLVLLFLLEFLLINVFTVLDVLAFYMFFESVLIPMFVIIGVWGSRARKVHAAYQFFLYTFFSSVFMLLAILFIYVDIGSTDYFTLLGTNFEPSVQLILWLAFFASFAVKIPMVPVHIWLPEAHVEAPTAGSVLLAGVLLKLGTYGLLRFSIPLFPYASYYFTPLVLVMGAIGVIYTSMTTLRQVDLKKIIAYSSVAHISLVTVGLFSTSLVGVEGAIMLMLSHGLVSSGLFLCVGILYDRYGTRLLRYYGGIINFMPLFGVVFLIFSLANMGFPLTSAFVGEITILLGAYSLNSFVGVIVALGIVFSAAYSTWLYNRTMFGPVSTYLLYYSDLNRREFFFLSALAFLVVFFGVFPNGLLETMHASVTNSQLSAFDWPVYVFEENVDGISRIAGAAKYIGIEEAPIELQ